MRSKGSWSSGSQTTYTHDPAGHLIGILDGTPADAVSFSIDVLGRHATQTIGSNPTSTYSYLGTSDSVTAITSTGGATYSTIDSINVSSAAGLAEAATPGATPAPDTTAPSVPTDLAATATSSTQIDLTWTASTDDTAVAGYNLYRDGNLIALVGSNSWFDTGLAPQSAHTYTVAAFDGSANTSEASTSASATTGPTPPASVFYAYDLADRLAAITTASGSTTTFGFDALGRHSSQTIGTTTQTYSYLGTSQVVVAITAGSSTTRSAIDAVGDRVATSGAGAAGFLLADLHGNTAGALNSNCTAITDAFAYDAYGNTVAAVTTALPTPWRYQGRMLESATGTPDLYDFGARSYSPALGTFTGLDTMHGSAQNPALLNGYLYANANPATLVDPDGHCVITSDNLDGCGNNYSASVTARAAVYETEGFKQAVAFKRQLDQLVNTVANKLRTGAEQYESDNDCGVHRPLCAHELSNLERYAGVSFTTDSETGATFRYNRDYAAASDADGWTAYNNCKLNPSDTIACAVSAKGNYDGQMKDSWNTTMTSLGKPFGAAGDVYSGSVGHVVNAGADWMRDTLGVRYSGTIGMCFGFDLSGNVGMGQVGGSAGFCAVATTNGQLGVIGYTGGRGGYGGGAHAGGDLNLLVSNGGDVSDQRGPFFGGGGHASDGPAGVDGDVQFGTNQCGNPLIVTATGGWDPGVGGEAHIGGSGTAVLWQSKPSAAC